MNKLIKPLLKFKKKSSIIITLKEKKQ